jgi:hypothetical protein
MYGSLKRANSKPDVSFLDVKQDDGRVKFKMDPRWVSTIREEEIVGALNSLQCDLLVVHGTNSHLVCTFRVSDF